MILHCDDKRQGKGIDDDNDNDDNNDDNDDDLVLQALSKDLWDNMGSILTVRNRNH